MKHRPLFVFCAFVALVCAPIVTVPFGLFAGVICLASGICLAIVGGAL